LALGKPNRDRLRTKNSEGRLKTRKRKKISPRKDSRGKGGRRRSREEIY